jgi:hypothetical protein
VEKHQQSSRERDWDRVDIENEGGKKGET